jgi:hypothetical protein
MKKKPFSGRDSQNSICPKKKSDYIGRKSGRGITKESIIEKTYCSENLPLPLFAKEG